MIDESGLVSLVIDLSAIPGPPGREGPIAAFVRDYVRAMGLEATQDQAGEAIGGDTGNVRILSAGRADLPHLLFNAHLDVSAPPARPILDRGRLVAPGGFFAADDRAGVGLLLAMLRCLPPPTERGTVELLLTVAEEAGLTGARQLRPTEVRADYGFVLDSPGPVGHIMVQGEAGQEFRVCLNGRPRVIEQYAAPDLRWIAGRVLSRLPVGTSSRGTTLEVLTLTRHTKEDLVLDGAVYGRTARHIARGLELVQAVVGETAARHGLAWTFRAGRCYPGYSLPGSAPVVRLAVDAARHVLVRPTLLGRRWASDANILNALGLPTVNLGGAWREAPGRDPAVWTSPGELMMTLRLLLALVALAGKRPLSMRRGGA